MNLRIPMVFRGLSNHLLTLPPRFVTSIWCRCILIVPFLLKICTHTDGLPHTWRRIGTHSANGIRNSTIEQLSSNWYRCRCQRPRGWWRRLPGTASDLSSHRWLHMSGSIQTPKTGVDKLGQRMHPIWSNLIHSYFMSLQCGLGVWHHLPRGVLR
jgi:hypothetical protein